MKSKRLALIAPAFLLLASLACGGASALPTATPVPPTAVPPTVTFTATQKPTSTPKPSPTPNLEATARVDEFQTLLKDFEAKGYVTTTDGKIVQLDDFNESWAQLGWYQWYPANLKISDFVFKAHFKWETANATPDISGCGIVFGLQDNNDHYAVFLDKSRILFLMGRGSNVYNVGKTKGPGRVNFGNPAEADFAISVKGQSAYVSVDGTVTEYTLSQDQTTKGEFAYTILSGTNKDFGTKCEMTNVMIWTP